jgi:hypothetical protein
MIQPRQGYLIQVRKALVRTLPVPALSLRRAGDLARFRLKLSNGATTGARELQHEPRTDAVTQAATPATDPPSARPGVGGATGQPPDDA